MGFFEKMFGKSADQKMLERAEQAAKEAEVKQERAEAFATNPFPKGFEKGRSEAEANIRKIIDQQQEANKNERPEKAA